MKTLRPFTGLALGALAIFASGCVVYPDGTAVLLPPPPPIVIGAPVVAVAPAPVIVTRPVYVYGGVRYYRPYYGGGYYRYRRGYRCW